MQTYGFGSDLPGRSMRSSAWPPVHPDDPGHSGVIEPVGLGQGRLQQVELSGRNLDILADVLGELANLADGVPVLLTLTPPSVEPAGLAQGGFAQPGPRSPLLTVIFATRTPCGKSASTGSPPRS
jgi:hypothetical protein